jgi:hypothetical protein
VPISDAVSFPELAEKLLNLARRWQAQSAFDDRHSEKIDHLLAEEAGLSGDWRTDAGPEQYASLEKILEDNPSGDAEDERGCSIAWNKIFDDLDPLTNKILSQAPRSFADIALQAQACALANHDLWGDGKDDRQEIRHLVDNICRLMGMAVWVADHRTPADNPSVAPANDDRIIALGAKLNAACGRHDKACTAFGVAERAMRAWMDMNPKPKIRAARGVSDFNASIIASANQCYSAVTVTLENPNADVRAAVSEWESAVKTWGARRRRAAARCKYSKADAAQKAGAEETSRLAGDLEEVPARSLPGIMIKARAAAMMSDDELAQSAIADLLDLESGVIR